MGLQSELELLKAVPVARDIDGKPWHMPIEGQHAFVVGRTGSGKNSITWSLVLRLAPAWKVGLVRYWGIDPKRIELAIGRGWWDTTLIPTRVWLSCLSNVLRICRSA